MNRIDFNDPVTFAVTAFTLSAALPTALVALKKSVNELSVKNNDPAIRKKRSLLHEKFSQSKVPSDVDYIVIGSGMSGLSCAAILARLGRKVVVLEQHPDVAGGGTHMFTEKGFTFDSGLHYTVPWSVPLFALTCLKKPRDCIPFDLMTEADGTVDKICLVEPSDPSRAYFRMKYLETHLPALYAMFPHEKQGLDKFMDLSAKSMDFVKLFLVSKLLPKWLQRVFWALVPAATVRAANVTAQDLLPTIIKDKKLISLLSSMWIDTGARPDRASFMLTASVFRGISMEGGCYPRGGSEEMAKELVTTIESNGGKVLIRADVQRILFDEALNKVVGVSVKDTAIRCKMGVVSSTGYLNTMNNLLTKDVTDRFHVARSLPVPQSAGFVMANIGINCSAATIGATKANTWHIPIDAKGDIFAPLQEYFTTPLAAGSPISAFITFPSLKDSACKDTDKVSCQVLLMADYNWFEAYLPANRDNTAARTEGYTAAKEVWKERCVEILLQHFPAAKPHLASVDISTPLSIEHYLRATKGASVGLDVSPERFCSAELRDELDPISKVPGLALTGQDVTICGVTLCQAAGVITAFRLEGLWAAIKIVGQSLLLGN